MVSTLIGAYGILIFISYLPAFVSCEPFCPAVIVLFPEVSRVDKEELITDNYTDKSFFCHINPPLQNDVFINASAPWSGYNGRRMDEWTKAAPTQKEFLFLIKRDSDHWTKNRPTTNTSNISIMIRF